MFVERHRAQRETGYGRLYRRRRGHLPLVCRRRALHLSIKGDADQLLYVRLCLLHQSPFERYQTRHALCQRTRGDHDGVLSAQLYRGTHRFNGYIHLKSIPGCSQELLNEAGRYADRMSVNIEIPKEESLKLLAPEKDHQSVFQPMKMIQQGVLENKEDRKKYRYAPRFVPAGQSTQMIVGATKESDKDILTMSSMLYGQPTMRRVYYSGYISVNTYDPRLPILKQPPLVRENRLYQADWLLRFYHFKVEEIVDDLHANLDLEVDPKLAWALRHPEAFPMDINTADYEQLLRVPGLGTKSAWLIVNSRRFNRLTSYDLKKMGVVMKKAKYFITCNELTSQFSQPIVGINELHPERLRPLLISKAQQKRAAAEQQLKIDFGE